MVYIVLDPRYRNVYLSVTFSSGKLICELGVWFLDSQTSLILLFHSEIVTEEGTIIRLLLLCL
jgi:hypothetical protein